MKPDPVRIIEAAYEHVPAENGWLSSLVDASVPYAVGGGVVAMGVDLREQPRVRSIVTTPGAEPFADAIHSFVGLLTPSFARQMFAPSELVGNAAWRLNRIAASMPPCAGESSRRPPLPPLWAMLAGDGATNSIVLAFPGTDPDVAPDQPFPHRDRKTLGLVGAHLGAALRLREVAAASTPATADDAVEAVLTPSGKILDAKGAGATPRARRSLSEAVVRSERARGRLRKTDSQEATTLWRALVAGRWSIVESIESDGKRLLVARANPLGNRDRAALSKSESDVVWLVAFGHSYKYIAYELGLTVSTVVRRLNAAMQKLGVKSRAELVKKLAR